ncbi:unnamed protein product [Effrenium voratum]|nr:unnamed protein product [Effrenium voratum]
MVLPCIMVVPLVVCSCCSMGNRDRDAIHQPRSQSPYLEVLVLLSGTEESTGAVVEARHSYTLDDIFWNRTYCPCVSINSEGFHCVDFHAIHHTYPLSLENQNFNGSIAHGISHTFPAIVHDDALDSEDE